MNPSRFESQPTKESFALRDIDIERRLAFLGLTEEDAARLRGIAPRFENSMEDFATIFYAHLAAFPETAKYIEDPMMLQVLKKAQMAHFSRVLASQWEDEYFSHSLQVGKTHADRGIRPELFLGSYRTYFEFCLKKLDELNPELASPATKEMQDMAITLFKAILLDIGVTLDAYFDRLTADLRQALSLYWSANRELRSFAELTSHDLKTPLATVANLCEEVVDEFGAQIPAGAKEMIEKARQRTYRMSTMIDELLSSSVHAASERVSTAQLKRVLEEAIDGVRSHAEQKSIILRLADNIPACVVDKVRMREACHNLLTNAIKFVHYDDGEIDISARAEEGSILLSIRDNGPGIPTSELERIFAPFHRISRDKAHPGSGLGLYFTKQLVEQFQGKIWAESAPDSGATFFIRFPLKVEADK
jgi:signal transduction histidine kinase